MSGDKVNLGNMQAMLNWAIQNGSHGSAPTPEGAAVNEDDPEFEEKRKHLMAALESITVDIVKIIHEAVQVLQLPDDADGVEDKKIQALEELLDLIEDLNNAEDFQRMGGIDLCMHALSSSHTSVQWRAADCLASAIQNHIPLQNYFGEIRGVPKVLELLASAAAPMVKVKLVRCLSCSLGGHAGNIGGFLVSKGVDVLAKLLSENTDGSASSSDNIKVAVKVAFSLAGLVDDHAPVAAAAREAGLVERLAATLKTSADAVLWEQCLRVLLTLSAADGGCHARLKDAELALASLIEDRKAYIASSVPAEDRPVHDEEQAHAAALLAKLATEPSTAAAVPADVHSPVAAGPGGGAIMAVPADAAAAAAAAGASGGRGAGGIAAGIAVTDDNGPKVEFVATYDWQAIQDNHILPAGLDIKIDLSTGAKFARMTPPAEGSTPAAAPDTAST